MHGPTATAEGPTGRVHPAALRLTLALTATRFTVVEVVGGVVTGSLALLADAAHMLSDNASLGVALFAAWLAGGPPGPSAPSATGGRDPRRAFNGVTLVAISIWIFIEAGQRFGDPPEVEAGLMLAIAAVGLAVNLLAARILSMPTRRESLNVSAALRHVLADLLGSVGVIVAAIVILLTGWEYADPVVGVADRIAGHASSWSILRDSVQILLEGSPPRHRRRGGRSRDLRRRPGCARCTTSTSGRSPPASRRSPRTCSSAARPTATRSGASSSRCSQDRFGLDHTTLQVDHEGGDLLQIETGPGSGTRRREKLTE